MSDLLVIVPSRGRPQSVARVAEAWRATGAYDDGARLVFAVDVDDPQYGAYFEQDLPNIGVCQVEFLAIDRWMPMVAKLNHVARHAATAVPSYFALGFAGDDHLPRTPGWAGRYLQALRELGTAIVYGDDLLQGKRLPTQWAMTSDIVRALGAMVPVDVEHLYCDNAIRDLGAAAGCLRYLPDVVVEHMHPLADKAAVDAGYARVNRPEQYRRDGQAYRRWVRERLADEAATVAALRPNPKERP